MVYFSPRPDQVFVLRGLARSLCCSVPLQTPTLSVLLPWVEVMHSGLSLSSLSPAGQGFSAVAEQLVFQARTDQVAMKY